MRLLRRHFARYTPEAVADVCGCTPEQVERVAELLCDNSGRERTSAIVYAVGWTQHTTGVQIIRAAGILQLLLGNIGRPGGGIMAMRGHASIQGSTDIPTLYDLLPGYLPQPAADKAHEKLDVPTSITRDCRPATGPTSASSSSACSRRGTARPPTADNDYRFEWLPRIDGDYSQLPTFDRMARGEMKGYFLFGQNPGGGGPNAGLHRAGLRNLDWLVVARLVRDRERRLLEERPERAAALRDQDRGVLHPGGGGPGEGGQLHQHPAPDPVARQGGRPARRLPLRCLVRLQPRQAAEEALRRLDRSAGPAAPEPHLGLRLRRAAAPAGRSVSRIEGEPDVEKVLQEINGYYVKEIDPRPAGRSWCSGFSDLKDDGSTACGCWIYSGVFPEPGRNRARERRDHRQPGAARMGLRLAAQPPRHVQPRLRRPRGPAVVGAEEATSGGTRRQQKLGRRRPAGLRAGQAARLPPRRRRQGHGRHRRRSSPSS